MHQWQQAESETMAHSNTISPPGWHIFCRFVVGLVLGLLLAWCPTARAQSARLPPIDSVRGGPWIEDDFFRGPVGGPDLPWQAPSPIGPAYTARSHSTDYTSYPSELSQPLVTQSEEEAFLSGRPSSSKPGIFQKLVFTGTWLDRGKRDDVGISELELYATFGFPMPTRESPLLITPGFEVRYLDGPLGVDLPARLFDTYLQFRWLRQVNDRWGFDVAVSPGLHTDFEDYTDDALRITGRGLASLQWTPDMKVVLGIVYLDRDDVSLLPAAGIVWTPSDEVRYELVFPRPRIAHRLFGDGHIEDWCYVVGEFGGGGWAIQRTSGAQGGVTIRDFRLLVGLERKADGGSGRRIEIGYVFGREVEFATATPAFEPDDTVMIRGGITY